jgi:hypothetical protein
MGQRRDVPTRTFVLEALLAGPAGRRDDGASVATACHDLQATGEQIEYLGALVVPEDELVLHLLRATSLTSVRRAAIEAGLAIERIVESFPVGARSRRAIRIPAGRSAEAELVYFVTPEG